MVRSVSLLAFLVLFLITLINTEATPLITEENVTNPEETQNNPEEIQTNPEKIQVNPAETPLNPVEIQANPAEIQVNPAETPLNPVEIQANPAEIQVNPAEIPPNPEEIPEDSVEPCLPEDISIESFKKIMPTIEEIQEEDRNGKILILQGSEEIGTRPYFVAMGALKAGADHVHVFTPESVAGLTQTYSPDFAVFPYFGRDELPMIEYAISTVDVVVLGPGPVEDGFLHRDIIQLCKDMKKPLILNSGAVFDIAMNISILNDYPEPGAILMPDQVELEALVFAIGKKDFSVWGDHVSVLVKAREDEFYSKGALKWSIREESIAKHTEEQADILAGFLGTFYNWALKSKACDTSPQFRRDIAAFAAAHLMRETDQEAYATFGRSTTSTDILSLVHKAFRKLFG